MYKVEFFTNVQLFRILSHCEYMYTCNTPSPTKTPTWACCCAPLCCKMILLKLSLDMQTIRRHGSECWSMILLSISYVCTVILFSWHYSIVG